METFPKKGNLRVAPKPASSCGLCNLANAIHWVSGKTREVQ